MLANVFDWCRRCISARLREIVRGTAVVIVNNVKESAFSRIRRSKDSYLYLVRTTEFRIISKHYGDDGRQAVIRTPALSTRSSSAICRVTYSRSWPRLNLCVKTSRLVKQERIFISHSAHSLVARNYTSYYVSYRILSQYYLALHYHSHHSMVHP